MRGSKNTAPASLADIYNKCNEVGDCMEWDGAYSAGKPVQFYGGKRQFVRRDVYVLKFGKAVPNGHRLFSKCENPRCVSEDHVVAYDMRRALAYVAKQVDQAVRAASISRNKRAKHAKVTMEIARELRASDETCKDAAARLNIHPSLVGNIRANKCWKEEHTPGNPFAGLMRSANDSSRRAA